MSETKDPAVPDEQYTTPRRRWLRGYRLWFVVSLLAYTLGGFVLLPWVVGQQLVSFIEQDLARPATLERVRFNPYTFTLSLEGLDVVEADGAALLRFDELFMDFELSSLLERALTFREIRLSHPGINYVRHGVDDSNILRALAPLLEEDSVTEEDTAESEDPFPVLVQKLVLDAGELDFSDLSLTTRFETHVGPVSFEVRDFATLRDRPAEQSFVLESEEGGRLEWTGKVEITPVRSAGHVSASGERLRVLWRYLQDQVDFEIADGVTALAFDYDLEVLDPEPRLEISNLEFTLEDLSVQPAGGGDEVLRLPRLAITGGTLDLQQRKVHLEQVRVSGVRLDTWRDEAGVLNLLRLARLAEEPEEASAVAGKKPPTAEAEPVGDGVSDSAGTVEEGTEPPVLADEVSDAGAEAATVEDDEASEAVASVPLTAEAADASDEVSDGDAAAPPVDVVASDEVSDGNQSGGGGEVTGNTAAAAPDAPDGQWSFSLGRFLVEDLALAFEDRGPTGPLKTGLEETHLELRNVSNKPGTEFEIDFGAVVTSGGRIAVVGKAGADPMTLDVKVDLADLSLLLAQPFIEPVARLELESALLSIEGEAHSGGGESLAFDGNLTLSDLSTKDTLFGERFVAWKTLTLAGLALRLDGRSFEVPELSIEAPYAKIAIAKDGTTNVGDILVGAESTDQEPGADGDGVVAGKEGEVAAPFLVSVGKITIQDGSANFADLTLPLPFETGIHSLRGEIAPISTQSSSPTKIKLRGAVADYGEARIDGKLNALDPAKLADIEVVFRNLDMTSFTPYAVKFAGHPIEEGKLTLELRYRLQDGGLEAGNRIVMDQLTLGDKEESPDAVDLPLGLVIALLKDSDGRIDLDVPVAGRLDEPEFSYGEAIRGAVMTILTKAITSPFRMLGSLVGSGDENLGRLTFAPGDAELGRPERERLAKLAGALAQRPKLSLTVLGRYAPKTDGRAMRRAKVDALVDAQVAEKGKSGDEAHRKALEKLFLAEFSKTERENLEAASTRVVEIDGDAGGNESRLDEAAYLDALTAQLARQQVVDEKEFLALADARAAVIHEFLVAEGISGERAKVVKSKKTTKILDGRVRVEIDLKSE